MRQVIWKLLAVLVVWIAIGTAQAQQNSSYQCEFHFETPQLESGIAFQARLRDTLGNVVGLGLVTGGWAPFETLASDDPLRALGRHTGRLDFCWLSDIEDAPSIITHCTGTLLADNFVLTAEHCLKAGEFHRVLAASGYELAEAQFVLGFDAPVGGSTREPRVYPMTLDQTEFRTASAVDAVLLPIGDTPNRRFGSFSLEVADSVQAGQRLVMVQHPDGLAKQVAQGESCQVHRSQGEALEGEIRHICPTENGSSGALILRTGDLAVVGVHVEGGFNPNDPNSFNTAYDMNQVAQLLGLEFTIAEPVDVAVDREELAQQAMVLAGTDLLRIQAAIRTFSDTRAAQTAQSILDQLDTLSGGSISGERPTAGSLAQIADPSLRVTACLEIERYLLTDAIKQVCGDALIRSLQVELTRHECQPGTIDGSYGQQSRDAIVLAAGMWIGREYSCGPFGRRDDPRNTCPEFYEIISNPPSPRLYNDEWDTLHSSRLLTIEQDLRGRRERVCEVCSPGEHYNGVTSECLVGPRFGS